MITTKESKGEALRRTTDAVLDAAAQFHEVDNDPDHGSRTRAVAWTEYLHALMNYHMAELAIFAGDQPASGVDCEHGPADICRCMGSAMMGGTVHHQPLGDSYTERTPHGMGTPRTAPTPPATTHPPHGLHG